MSDPKKLAEEIARDAGSRCFHISQHDDRFLLACPRCISEAAIPLLERAREETLLEAARAVCEYCKWGDPPDPARGCSTKYGHIRVVGNSTSYPRCRANEIRKLIEKIAPAPPEEKRDAKA